MVKSADDRNKIFRKLSEFNFASATDDEIPSSQIGNSFRGSQMSMNSTASQELDITRFTLRQTITL